MSGEMLAEINMRKALPICKKPLLSVYNMEKLPCPLCKCQKYMCQYFKSPIFKEDNESEQDVFFFLEESILSVCVHSGGF